jgi:nitric oxide reductase NorE protein
VPRTAAPHLPGEQGVWVVILGELTIFALFFGVYVWARGEDPQLFASSQEHLNQSRAVINTLLLLTSSLCVASAVKAARTGDNGPARRFLLAALGGGAGFWLVKVLEYRDLFGDGFTPGTDDFFMYYFVFTWLHLLHLLVGMGVLVFLRSLAGRAELTPKQVGYLEAGGCYWHMVDVIWIVLFPLLYLVR